MMSFDTVKKNLEALGYTVVCFDTKEEAAEYLDKQIDHKTVGFGGSVTLQQMGMYEKLSGHNEVFWHWQIPEGKTAPQILKEEQDAQIYLTSANGLAQTGEIVNIDGNCNRISAMVYGHEKVYFVIGKNKLAKDYDGALDHARNVAAPLNAKRLGKKTPCAVKGDRCYNCKSPDRICKGLSVLWGKPSTTNCEVVLIEEELGY